MKKLPLSLSIMNRSANRDRTGPIDHQLRVFVRPGFDTQTRPSARLFEKPGVAEVNSIPGPDVDKDTPSISFEDIGVEQLVLLLLAIIGHTEFFFVACKYK